MVDGAATGNHLTLKTAAMMNRKGTTTSRDYQIPAMSASFFSETDNEDSEIDEVEEQLLRAFLQEKTKIARSTSGDIDCEETTATATESWSSDDIMDEHNATETADKDLERQPYRSKSKPGKRTSKLSSSKETSEKSKCSDSTVSKKEASENRSSKRHSRTSPSTKETRKNKEDDETSIRRNSSKSRSSLKKGSSHRRRCSVESEASDHLSRKSPSRSSKTDDVDYDDDISESSFYQEALELDEGGEDGKLQKLASPSRQGTVRRRGVSARRRSMSRRRSLSKKSLSEEGAGDDVTAVVMETKTTYTPELARVTRNSRRRSSIATGQASEIVKKNIQSILSNCDDMNKMGERDKSSRREGTNVSASKNETTASKPIQFSAADALCDAQGDQEDALARILQNAKEIRAANTPLAEDQSDSEDEQKDEGLVSVRQILARSAIAAAPGRARRRGSVGALSRC